jgi:glucose/arabinose dehydrogenase
VRLPAFLLALLVVLLPACAAEDEDGAAPAGTRSVSETGVANEDATTTGRAEEPVRLRVQPVVRAENPVHLATASEPNRLYVVEQEGTIRVVEDGKLRAEPFLDISDSVQAGGEQGLLSVAFHPDYERNGRFYVDYTDVDGDTRVVEYRTDSARTAADPDSGRVVLAVDQPYSNHNGGQLAFGPDGRLYVGMGDGGGGGDPENRAQDLSDRLGKLLRLDVDDPGAGWEVVAYGLRNPWRFSFDRENGDLYVGDVGQGAWEEVDYVPRSSGGLVNFGWDVFEGRARYEDKDPNPAGRLAGPVAVYPLQGDHCSVIGGFVYRGSAIPGLRGRYFYGDFCSGTVWSFRIANGKARAARREAFKVPGLSSFGEDVNGELYLVSLSGPIYRLAAAA